MVSVIEKFDRITGQDLGPANRFEALFALAANNEGQELTRNLRELGLPQREDLIRSLRNRHTQKALQDELVVAASTTTNPDIEFRLQGRDKRIQQKNAGWTEGKKSKPVISIESPSVLRNACQQSWDKGGAHWDIAKIVDVMLFLARRMQLAKESNFNLVYSLNPSQHPQKQCTGNVQLKSEPSADSADSGKTFGLYVNGKRIEDFNRFFYLQLTRLD